MTVRTRIAPSPTGDPHVGTGYIALFNYAFAKHHGGQFILRIEDTDQLRSTRESEEKILQSLRWLGLDWDEGPDIGGPCGPYRQSERSAIYAELIKKLIDNGTAFPCFCTAERLDNLRKEQLARKENPGYDGCCMHIPPEEAAKRIAAGEPHVIRLKVPREGKCIVPDYLRGNVEIEWSQIDMQVLMKTDGLPTYHFANVVDDHLMGITHVLRGEEWISSAPKHLLLYKAFGWEPPVFCHLPLLRNPDKSKLSKRKNPTSMLYYERIGILPEGLLNYLGRMAWSMPDDREKFTLQEMIDHFTLDRISMGGPVFDLDKLNWLNGLWVRELTEDQFAERVAKWAINSEFLRKIIPLVQVRTEKLSDLGNLTPHFFQGLLNLTPEQLAVKKLEPQEMQRLLTVILWELEKEPAWNTATIENVLKNTAELCHLKLRELLAPLFVAITGKAVSTPLYQTMEIIGRDISRARIRQAIDTLGPISKKTEKEWEKRYAQDLKDYAEAKKGEQA